MLVYSAGPGLAAPILSTVTATISSGSTIDSGVVPRCAVYPFNYCQVTGALAASVESGGSRGGATTHQYASMAWDGTQNVPTARVYAEFAGVDNWVSGVGASAVMDSLLWMKFRGADVNFLGGSIGIRNITFTVRDEGYLGVGAKSDWYLLGQYAAYERSISLRSGAPTYTTGPSTFTKALWSDLPGGKNEEFVKNTSEVSMYWLSPLGITITSGEEISVLFDFSTSVNATSYAWGSGGVALAQFRNTSAIDSIQVFDTQGQNVTSYFSFTDPAGRNAFTGAAGSAVPEPSTMLFVAGGLLTLMHRKRRTYIVKLNQ